MIGKQREKYDYKTQTSFFPQYSKRFREIFKLARLVFSSGEVKFSKNNSKRESSSGNAVSIT